MHLLENKKSILSKQSGQALVEYILLISISIALVLAFATQFYKPFGNWMQNYMGEYLQCLLDYGELPTMGSVGVDGECAQSFKPFSPVGGRPPLKNKNKNSSGSAAGSNFSANEKSQGNKTTFTSGTAGRSRSMVVAGGAGADGKGAGAGEKQVVEKLSDSRFEKFRNSNKSTTVAQNSTVQNNNTIAISSSRKEIIREQEKYVKLKPGEVETGEASSKNKKLIISPPEKKAEVKEEGFEWNFGQYLKFALILAIIIAIVLFVGGQILQISKSMEK